MAEDPRPRTIDVLVDRIAASPELLSKVKDDPVTALTDLGTQVKKQYPAVTAVNDRFTYRIAVMVLALVVVIVAVEVGIQWHAANGAKLEVPELLISIGSTALGALAGLLMPGGPQRG